MRKYKGIDVGRLLFACLIPILHISLPGTYIIQQYLSRIGVPYFYAVSGMFLSLSMNKRGISEAWVNYILKIGRLLIIWLLLYSPLMITRSEISIQTLLFRTPAYLWYLTGLIVASIPFCFIKNRKVLFTGAAILYIVGTFWGDTYRWLVGGVFQYEKIFLTTRNGLFFGLLLMCIGELTWKRRKASISALLITGVLLIIEITHVGVHALPGEDRSMYFKLPGVVYFLVIIFRERNPQVDIKDYGGLSSAIYLMQYGIIVVSQKVFEIIGLNYGLRNWFVYMQVLAIPIIVCRVISKTKVEKIIF